MNVWCIFGVRARAISENRPYRIRDGIGGWSERGDFRFGALNYARIYVGGPGLRFVSRLWWAADGVCGEVAGCRFEFRRILFWENVEGWEGVVCGVRKRWTGEDFGFRGAGGSWYGTIFLYVSACACALCACVRARARGKTFEVDPRLFSCGPEKFGLSDDGLPFASWP